MREPFDVAAFTARYSERRIRITDMIGRRGRFITLAMAGFFYMYSRVQTEQTANFATLFLQDNLFAAVNVGTGEVVGECRPSRDGDTFLAFLKKSVKPHAGKEIHVVLDNLSTHTTPEVKEWLEKNPNVEFHFTPVGSSWLNQIETWFGVITRQAIRRGTFSSVKVLIKRIQNYIAHWNSNAEPFVWTATADEILAKVRFVQANIKKLLDNNAK
jgi:transposase